MLDIFELQKELVAAALPSGIEGRQASVIKNIASHYCDEFYTDTLGNLIFHVKGPGKKLMFAAHMDVIGFMVTFIDERGFIRFVPVGGHTPAYLIGTSVKFENGVCGCIQPDEKAKPGSTSLSDVALQNLYIDIGAESYEDAISKVQPGMCAVWSSEPKLIADGNMMTPYADNLTSCAVLLSAMSEMVYPVNDVWCVFSVQEELGCRGAQPAAFGIAPQYCIAVDVTHASTPDASGPDTFKAGCGAVITVGPNASRKMSDALMAYCKANEIGYKIEVAPSHSGTNAWPIQIAREGVCTGILSVPLKYMHSPVETVKLSDAETGVELLTGFLKDYFERGVINA
jgi:endoglucanase